MTYCKFSIVFQKYLHLCSTSFSNTIETAQRVVEVDGELLNVKDQSFNSYTSVTWTVIQENRKWF